MTKVWKIRNFYLADTRLGANFFFRNNEFCFASYDMKKWLSSRTFHQYQMFVSYSKTEKIILVYLPLAKVHQYTIKYFSVLFTNSKFALQRPTELFKKYRNFGLAATFYVWRYKIFLKNPWAAIHSSLKPFSFLSVFSFNFRVYFVQNEMFSFSWHWFRGKLFILTTKSPYFTFLDQKK